MPHQCTNCGRAFPDGSKQMLSGCPDCGGNKFQFRPDGAVDVGGDGDANPNPDGDAPRPDARDDPTPGSGTGAGTGVDADADAADGDAEADPDPDVDVEASPDPGAVADAPEDRAQADARSDVVSPDELADAGPVGAGGPAGGPEADPPGAEDARATREPKPGDRPDLSELREALNSQFESIRIVSPGQYELNLMELYDRQEYIISLQEDGRYVIEMPDAWGADADDADS